MTVMSCCQSGGVRLDLKVKGRCFLPMRSRGNECKVSGRCLARDRPEVLLKGKDDTALMLRNR
jgi:hypothetical protein